MSTSCNEFVQAKDKEKRSLILWVLASLFAITLMAPGDIKAENDIEKMTIIQSQREKDMEDDYYCRDSSKEPHQTTGNCVVVDTITAPGESCGLAWDKGNLWASIHGNAPNYPGVIFKIDTDGNILSSFGAPGQSSKGPHPKGLGLDGTYLWSVDFLDDKNYKLAKSGAVIDTIPAPSGIPSGLAWDGENLWVSEWFSYKIYKLNPANGQILTSFNAPDFEEEYPYGLAWDGTHLWASNSNGIYMLDPATGAVLASCNDSAFKYGKAYGLTWDGQYLWGGGWISDAIIKIDVSALAVPTIPLPTSQESFSYPPSACPVMSSVASAAKPVGVGSIATGGNDVSLLIGTGKFSGTVDIYFGIYMPAIDPDSIYILSSDNSLRRLSEVGLVPWKAGTNGPINEAVFGDIPTSSLPFGKYTLYLMAALAGNPNIYYLWSTYFEISEGDTHPPSVPTGLTATAVSSNQISLSWTASTDNVAVTGYKIYRDGTYLKTVSAISTSDTGLNSSTRYCYTVSAFDAAGNNSAQSDQACATTHQAGPVDVVGWWEGTILVAGNDEIFLLHFIDDPKLGTWVNGAFGGINFEAKFFGWLPPDSGYSVSGNVVTFTAEEQYGSCNAQWNGTGTVSGNHMSGTFSGSDCTISISNAPFSLTRTR